MPDIYISKDTKKKKPKKTALKKTKPVSRTKQTLTTVDSNKKGKSHQVLPGNNYNPLSSFYYHPDRVSFETQEGEEKVILLLRRHIVTNVPWIIGAVLMIIAPIVILPFIPILSFLPSNYQIVAVLGWYLVTTAFILENFLSWFFNVNLITDERIVDIDFHNLIYKEVSDAKIDKIQDTTYNMGGVARTMFNYGDVFIQTAAEVPTFEYLAVPQPDKVVKILKDLMQQEEQEKIEGRVR